MKYLHSILFLISLGYSQSDLDGMYFNESEYGITFKKIYTLKSGTYIEQFYVDKGHGKGKISKYKTHEIHSAWFGDYYYYKWTEMNIGLKKKMTYEKKIKKMSSSMILIDNTKYLKTTIITPESISESIKKHYGIN